MPLPPPPCIDFFVDCNGTYTGGGSGGGSGGSSGTSGTSSSGRVNVNVGDVDVNLGGSLDASGLRNGIQSGLDSAGTAAANAGARLSTATTNAIGTIGSAGSSLAAKLSSTAQRIAQYTVTATNRGVQAVKGYVFSHGPLPSGAVFDPSRSSKECVQTGQTVQCTTDLEPGQSKSFELAYKVNNSISCAIARALQTVKNITGTSGSNVTTSVSCTTKTVNGSEGTQTGADGTAGANGQSGANGVIGGATGSGGAMAANIDAIGLTYAGGTGYKPYPMPRTGAADLLFSATKKDYTLTSVATQQSSSVSFPLLESAVMASVILIAVGVRMLRKFAF